MINLQALRIQQHAEGFLSPLLLSVGFYWNHASVGALWNAYFS